MGRIKKIILLTLCAALVTVFASCGEDETAGTTTTTLIVPPTGETQEPPKTIEVSGKSYKMDKTTINVAWEEGGEEPTQYQQETFVAHLKALFGESVITFTDENSFIMSGTDGGQLDFEAQNCDRVYNELYQKIGKLGNVDVVIENEKISFLSDFFIVGWKMYFSIDYTLIK